MSVLPIVRWPDARLSTVCEPVSDIASARALADDLPQTMYAAFGRGLASPQVGVLQRLFVMDVGWKDGTKTPRVCINPEISEASGDVVEFDEGCLSIPGILVPVKRPSQIVLRYTDLTGADHSETLTGFEAICAQHELDHLNGRVTFDHLQGDAKSSALADYEALL